MTSKQLECHSFRWEWSSCSTSLWKKLLHAEAQTICITLYCNALEEERHIIQLISVLDCAAERFLFHRTSLNSIHYGWIDRWMDACIDGGGGAWQASWVCLYSDRLVIFDCFVNYFLKTFCYGIDFQWVHQGCYPSSLCVCLRKISYVCVNIW